MKLELTREEILEKLIRSYEGYFDIERSDDFEPPLQAVCHFNVRSAKYVLLKKECHFQRTCLHIFCSGTDRRDLPHM